MTDLTEKSKIKEGYYYAIVNGEQNIVKKVRGLKHPYCNGFCCDCYKYLSPVPSYEEWKFAQEQLHKEGTWYTERAYKNVRKAVRELTKKLLQVKPELRDWLEVNYGEYL